MSEIDVDALRKLLAEATPGEWKLDKERVSLGIICGYRLFVSCGGKQVIGTTAHASEFYERNSAYFSYDDYPCLKFREGEEPPYPPDLRLTVALRNNADALLSELTRLRRIEAAAREYRRAQRTGGGCDVETTERLAARIEETAAALDAALGVTDV